MLSGKARNSALRTPHFQDEPPYVGCHEFLVRFGLSLFIPLPLWIA
jgi:hypothetical protein